MFGRNKDKAKVQVETAKGGGPIKRLRVMIGAGVVIGVIHAAEAYFGTDFLPVEMEQETAELILNVIDLGAAWFAWRAVKPAVVQAADAQGVDAVAAVKAEANVKPAAIIAAEPAINAAVIDAGDAAKQAVKDAV